MHPEHQESPGVVISAADLEEADFPLYPLEWSRRAELANQVWFALDTANRFLLLSRWGTERTEQLEFHFIRKHQETHFLDGLAKLGLDSEPPHIASAKYHVQSNVLGGLDMGYRLDDEGRAWIFYFPPSPFGASSMQPGPGVLCVPTPVILAGMRGWHANNGVLLNAPRLQFTVTDLLSEGGPYDAGYFSLAEVEVAEDDRLVISFDEVAPVPSHPPALAGGWPQGRRDAALEKYSAQYAVGGLAQIAQRSSLDEAAIIAEAAFTTVFVSWSRILIKEFKINELNSRSRLARLMEETFALIGEQLVRHESADGIRLETVRTRLTAPEYEGWECTPDVILDAIATSWCVASRAIGVPRDVTVTGGANPIWTIK